MWKPVVSATRFGSRTFRVTDEEATGKWLVPATLGDPDGIWERISAAAASGVIVGAKISSQHLDRILGHHLICAYCERSDRHTVEATLGIMRGLGVEGHLRYKTCLATVEGREEFLWNSDVIELGSGPETADTGFRSSNPGVR
jgi:hypothetical protein